ncbi:MAG: TonB-dependent receptor [Gemmatimonadaceae bacterium]|nr:TonB-dependent receptor [Gemmatimonadaceae bacterium]
MGSAAQATPPLERRVSLDLRDVRLETALEAINRQAHLGLSYTARLVPLDKIVSISGRAMTAREALATVLRGTGVVATVTPSGAVILERGRAAPADTTPPTASVTGRVQELVSGRPLPGAIVSIAGTTLGAAADDSGYYRIPNVPLGPHTLRARLIGYVPIDRPVIVTAPSTRMDFALSMSTTKLEDVIVTATGPVRRMELGNDITHLNGDSITRTQPIRSVTDLLASRVPGLVVLPTSGVPGDPARIRLRGASSVYLSNDPIIVVDGVRVYSDLSSNRARNLTSTSWAAPSALDQIDPNSIESIEVVKGPSAATLYGQDAANGVIVITTKKGKAGPPRWTASVDRGITNIPTTYPTGYFRWGKGYGDNTPRYCGVRDATCTVDSIVPFQLLNDPHYTVVDQGQRLAGSLGVMGGVGNLTYNVTGNASDETGYVKLPDAVAAQYSAAHGGLAPPSWMRRPERYTRWGATSRLASELGKSANVSLTSIIERGTQQRSDLEFRIKDIMATYYDPATNQYYVGSVASDGTGRPFFSTTTDLAKSFYTQAKDVATTFQNSLNVTWRPLSWLQGSADAGLQVINRDDQVLVPFGVVPASQGDTTGSLSIGRGQSLVRTVNLRATATKDLPRGFRLETGIGVNYVSTSLNDFSASGQGLAPGTSTIGSIGNLRSVGQSSSDITSFGWYIEPRISHKRLWLSTGLRLDGGSTFGSHVKLPAFPKLGLSYLISDESWFPFKSVFNTFRLRTAYGRAGTWPGPQDRLRLFNYRSAWLDGQLVPVASISKLGNTKLRPERSTEYEGGFDADMLNDRISVSFSAYYKKRFDAILNVPVPPSVGGAGYEGNVPRDILANVGTIRNVGVESSVEANLVRSEAFEWSLGVGVSRNHNKMIALGQGIEPFFLSSTTRIAPGYPLEGLWARPILGYADQNQDGVIQPSEVVVGDSAIFIGENMPHFESSLHTSLAFFRRALTIDATFDYQDGLTQMNTALLNEQLFSKALSETGQSLDAQAALAALDRTPWGLIQTASTVRLLSLVVSYSPSRRVAQRIGADAMTISLQGGNLGLWTRYHGMTPNVNGSSSGNPIVDTGNVPTPRTWQMRVSLSY